MSNRRLSLLFLAGVLLATALPAASATAASPKVLLVTRGEAGEGPPAVQGETAHITTFLDWNGGGAFCGGVDEAATVGKNPAPKVKVTGSNAPLSGFSCFGSGEPSGSASIKFISLAKNGAVTLMGRFEIQAEGCHYRAGKLTGTQAFGADEQFAPQLTGVATLVKKGTTNVECPPAIPLEDQPGVADAEGYDYLTHLTS